MISLALSRVRYAFPLAEKVLHPVRELLITSKVCVLLLHWCKPVLLVTMLRADFWYSPCPSFFGRPWKSQRFPQGWACLLISMLAGFSPWESCLLTDDRFRMEDVCDRGELMVFQTQFQGEDLRRINHKKKTCRGSYASTCNHLDLKELLPLKTTNLYNLSKWNDSL